MKMPYATSREEIEKINMDFCRYFTGLSTEFYFTKKTKLLDQIMSLNEKIDALFASEKKSTLKNHKNQNGFKRNKI